MRVLLSLEVVSYTLSFQYVPVADQGALETLAEFKKETVYACIFPCVVCAQAHFRSNVVEASAVDAFATVDGIGRHCLQAHLEDARFLALGSLWCCRQCKLSVDQGKIPPMSARNDLATPWATPANACLNWLSPTERQVFQNWHPFQKVSRRE